MLSCLSEIKGEKRSYGEEKVKYTQRKAQGRLKVLYAS